jgi:hypothetical protein
MTPHPDTAVPELDELTITIVVDTTADTLSSVSPGISQLPELAYLLGGVPTGQHYCHDCHDLRPTLTSKSSLPWSERAPGQRRFSSVRC